MLAVFLSVIFLLCFSEEVAKFLVAANDLEMMSGDYAFTTLDFIVQDSWQTKPWAGGRSPEDFIALFDGIINLSVKELHGERFENYSRELNEVIKANNISQTPLVSIKFYFQKTPSIPLHRITFNVCFSNETSVKILGIGSPAWTQNTNVITAFQSCFAAYSYESYSTFDSI